MRGVSDADKLMTESEAYVVLNMLPKVGPGRVRRLAESLGGALPALTAGRERLMRVDGIGADVAAVIAGWESHADLTGELAAAKKLGVAVLTPADSGYPENLRNIYDPPLALYVKGRIESRDSRSVAVVGSRQPSYYGRESARKLGYQLAYAGMTVVSGLARGVDTHAHEGAIAAKGRTIAVLGCGIDQIYPPENRLLSEKVIEAGALVSEFPIGTKPDRQTFPIRNRVVAGLSLGILVVEAPRNSGALITARMGLDQGRQIFAVPGRVDTPHSRGCHQLIKDGARLVEGAEDVLAEFEFLLPGIGKTPPKQPASAGVDASQALDQELIAILGALGPEERHIDEIIRICGLPPAKVSSSLLQLELRRLVRPLPGKFFVRLN